ncbi:MAG: methylmalonyl-CoA epimerase [Candidatus Eisenbacteria bacterium]|nr:methylmalonyl-CoA epimerase [Candidatus Eisenbacteria bacterium]
MIRKIDHIGLAVLDPARALQTFSEALGLRLDQIEDIPSQKLRSYHLAVGESHIELLYPTDPDSTVAKFLDKKGPGVHHVALQVDDIEAERDRLVGLGFEALSAEPFIGAGGKKVLFFHPRTTGGVLLEICQLGEAAGHHDSTTK